jgi:hypothetical protein
MAEKLQRFNGGAYAPSVVLRELRELFERESGKAIQPDDTLQVFWEAYHWYHSPMIPHPVHEEQVLKDHQTFLNGGPLPFFVMVAYCRKLGLEHDITADLPINFRRV